jgi:hypothetical protein
MNFLGHEDPLLSPLPQLPFNLTRMLQRKRQHLSTDELEASNLCSQVAEIWPMLLV